MPKIESRMMKRTLLVTTALALAASCSPVLAQQFVSTGDVTPTAPATGPWTVPGNLTVGNTGSGAFTIQNGGSATEGGDTYLGFTATGTGQLTVNNATLTTGRLFLGWGNGSQNNTALITNGSTVNVTNAVPNDVGIGQATGSTGTMTVSNNSTLNLAGSMGVGQFGTGTLNVLSGSKVNIPVTGAGLFIGNAAAGTSGTVLVDGTGSAINDAANIYLAAQGNGTMTVQNGGTATVTGNVYLGFFSGVTGQLTINNATLTSARLLVGNASGAQGNVLITNGSTVTSTAAIADTTSIGEVAGSSGTVTVSNNSVWNSVGSMGVGESDNTNGTLNVLSGSKVNITNAAGTGLYVGNVGVNSKGTVLIDGAGSAINDVSNVYVGGISGTGTVTVQNGGLLHADGTINAGGAAFSGPTATGTITVTGAGSAMTAGGINIGGKNQGTLNVLNQASVSTGGALDVGVLATAVGTAVVDGNGTNVTAGALTVGDAGTGTLTLSNKATVNAAGGTTIAAQAGSTGTLNIGAAAGAAPVAPGTLNTPTVTFGAGTGDLVFNHTDNSGNYTFAAAVSGPGKVDVDNGWTVMTGNSTYTGGTTINAGTLQLGNGGTSGSITGNVTDNSALIFNRADTVTFPGTISGSGTVTQAGAGTTILTANNTYTGGTTISAGTLQLGNGGTTGGIVGNVTDNGALAFNRSDVVTFPGTISGTGSVNQAGTGTTILTANNTYTGGTTISAGTLQLGNGGTSGAIVGNVTDNGTLAFDRSDIVTFPGTISGSGSVTQAGTGTTILTANSTYTGGTTISAGTLQLGNGGTTGGIVGNVTDNGALVFDRSNTVTFGGTISGTGSVAQIGSGMTVLNANNTYSGPTNVTNGTLAVGDASHLSAALSGGGAVTVAKGATLGGFGSVAGSVTNNGTIAVGNALPAFSSEPDTTFNIGGNLNNSGLVTLVGTTPGNTLKVAGNFVGTGNSVLALKTVLNGGGPLSNQFTDRLLVGGSADPTIVRVVPVGTGAYTSVNAPTASTGISIVQVAGASSVGAFNLAGGYVTGGTPFQYRLNAYGPGSSYGAADPTQNLVGNANNYWDYRLQNVYITPAGVVPPAPSGTPLPPDARPAVAPQVPAYITAPTALFNAGLMDIDQLHRRLGEIRDGQANDVPKSYEIFARGYGSRMDYTTSRSFGNYGFDSSMDYAAFQVGASAVALDDKVGTLRVGLAGSHGELNFEPHAVDGWSKGNFDNNKVSGIATYQARAGWYVDLIAFGGWFDGNVDTRNRGETAHLTGTSLGASAEAGYPIPLGWQKLVLEPQVQMSWQRLIFDGKTDRDGIAVNIGTLDQGVARVGARLVRPFEMADNRVITPYLKVNLLQGFGDGDSIKLSNFSFPTGRYGTAVQVGGGVSGMVTKNIAIYGDVSWQDQVSSGGFRGWAFNGGARYSF